MLTPIEIHNAQHKTGRGYSKKEMDEFLDNVSDSYEAVYKENIELKNKLSKLANEIEYYKSMETTLQKALVLAEKTSKDTIDTARKEAGVIEKQAAMKADKIINQASAQYDTTRQKCIQLIQQYNQFKMQFKQIAIKQIDLLESDFYEIYSSDLTASLNEAIDKSEENSVKPENAETAEMPENKEPENKEQDNKEPDEPENINSADTRNIPPLDIDESADDNGETKSPEIKQSADKETEQENIETDDIEMDDIEINDSEIDDIGEIGDIGAEESDKPEKDEEEKKEKDNIPPVDLESIDSLLRDIRQDFADRQEEISKNDGNDTQFEFLDNE